MEGFVFVLFYLYFYHYFIQLVRNSEHVVEMSGIISNNWKVLFFIWLCWYYEKSQIYGAQSRPKNPIFLKKKHEKMPFNFSTNYKNFKRGTYIQKKLSHHLHLNCTNKKHTNFFFRSFFFVDF